MNLKMFLSISLSLMCLFATGAYSQSTPSGLIGCLDGNGNLYNLVPIGQITQKCPDTDLQVELGPGTINGVSPGPGLIGGGLSGNISIGIDPKFALPPSCPPGQVALSDDAGDWVCTPPQQLTNPNPVGKLWLIGHTEAGSLRARGSNGTTIKFINTSNEVGEVTFLFFTRDGNLLFDFIKTLRVPRGGTATARTGGGGVGTVFGADWALVVSNISGIATAFSIEATGPTIVQSYPIDCRFPEGYEFVCGFAGE